MEENITIQWEAYDKPEKEKKVDWFWALGLIGIAGSVLAFIFDNFLFGVFIILAIVVVIFFATQKPKKVKYIIDEKGIHAGQETISYKKITGFYLDENGEWGKLLIQTTHPVSPILGFYYEDKNIGDDIYEALQHYKVEEVLLVEPITHQIFEKLGF